MLTLHTRRVGTLGSALRTRARLLTSLVSAHSTHGTSTVTSHHAPSHRGNEHHPFHAASTVSSPHVSVHGHITGSTSQVRVPLLSTLPSPAVMSTPASTSTSATSPPTRKKHRIVVLGCGWAGFRFLKAVDRQRYEVTCISPRNHFVFTPLLASTTVGTLEFRAIIEPVRTLPDVHYVQATCESVDLAAREIVCREVYDSAAEGERFARPLRIAYDDLVVAVGARTATFNTPGVHEHAMFLKDLSDARRIRSRILECFEHAASPSCTPEERRRLLTFVIVGGGPTGVEFAGELRDFLDQDVSRWYPDLVARDTRVELIEAGPQVLGAFDRSLRDYVASIYRQGAVHLRASTAVERVEADAVVVRPRAPPGAAGPPPAAERLPCGLVVWSTGLEPAPLTRTLAQSGLRVEPRSGRLEIDEKLEVVGGGGHVHALGDCAVVPAAPLPPTAQVAQQQGVFLARRFNAAGADGSTNAAKPFLYRHMGKLAYLGGHRAVADLDVVHGRGFAAFLFWRSSYLTMLMSWSNKMLVPMHWFKAFVFGRDIARF